MLGCTFFCKWMVLFGKNCIKKAEGLRESKEKRKTKKNQHKDKIMIQEKEKIVKLVAYAIEHFY